MASFKCVSSICFSKFPYHTSGSLFHELLINASLLFSTDKLVSSSPALIDSSAFHKVCVVNVFVFKDDIATEPPTNSVNKILLSGCHVNHDGVDFRLGVRFSGLLFFMVLTI